MQRTTTPAVRPAPATTRDQAEHGPSAAGRTDRPRRRIDASLVTVLGLILGAWAAFTAASLAQHRAYYTNAFDLGFFDQIIWNTAHGRLFATSFVPYNFAGQHMEPVLLLFAAAYRLGAGPSTLLVTQATVAAWAALPLFTAARTLLRSGRAAVTVAAAYLLAPHLHGAVLFDFHPEVLATAAIFGAFALLVAHRPGLALAAFAVAFLLKEDAALAGIGFALILWLRGYRRYAVALLGLSVLYLAVVVGVVMPAIRGGPGDLQERYGYLGVDARGIVAGALRHPDRVVEQLVSEPVRSGTAYMLGAMALLPIAGPAVLAALPVLAVNVLSTHPPQAGLHLHYAILPFTLLLVAAVLGIERSARSAVWSRIGLNRARATVVLAGVLLLGEGVAFLLGSPLGPRRFYTARYQATSHTAAVVRVLRAVPSDAALSAQSGLLPHLSHRREVWEFPQMESARYEVIDRRSWHSSQAGDAGYEGTLDRLPALGFCPLVQVDGVELWERTETCGSR